VREILEQPARVLDVIGHRIIGGLRRQDVPELAPPGRRR
jgi:hypothetical protein